MSLSSATTTLHAGVARVVAVLLLIALNGTAFAQVRPAASRGGDGQAPDAPAPGAATPKDNVAVDEGWDGSTPRRAVRSFLDAARDDRWSDAARVLDLSALSSAERGTRGPQLARKLSFLLEQNERVDVESLSDDPAGVRDDGLPETREEIATPSSPSADGAVYLERTLRSDGESVWRFAPSTVARITPLYRHLGIPQLIDDLPAVLLQPQFLELALWQWIGLILFAIGAWLVGWLAAGLVVRIFTPLTARSKTDVDDKVLAAAVGPVRLLIALAAFNAMARALRLSADAGELRREASKFLVIAGIAWLALRLIDLFAERSRARFLERGHAGAAYLVPLGARAIKVVVGLITILAMLGTFGFDVTAIIASLGVGGLAVALAAQKTVENVFGGISVLVDQPIKPGEFCGFGDKVGTVEDIGLRSTRIRTLDRTVISVPNAEFSTLQIENFARRDRMRFLATLPLRHETTPEQLRSAMDALGKLLASHPKALPTPHVRLVSLNKESIDLELFAYFDTTDGDEFMLLREKLYLAILDIVSATGARLAVPSHTTYVARDRSLDRDMAVHAPATRATPHAADRPHDTADGRHDTAGARHDDADGHHEDEPHEPRVQRS